jgi:hypothetical protein
MAETIIKTWNKTHTQIRKDWVEAVKQSDAGDKVYLKTAKPGSTNRKHTCTYYGYSDIGLTIRNKSREKNYNITEIFHKAAGKNFNFSGSQRKDGIKYTLSIPMDKKEILHVAEWTIKPTTFITKLQAVAIATGGPMAGPHEYSPGYLTTTIRATSERCSKATQRQTYWDGKRLRYTHDKSNKNVGAYNEKALMKLKSSSWAASSQSVITKARAVVQSTGSIQNPDSAIGLYYNIKVENFTLDGFYWSSSHRRCHRCFKACYKDGAFWYKIPRYQYSSYRKMKDAGKEMKLDAINTIQVIRGLKALKEFKVGSKK